MIAIFFFVSLAMHTFDRIDRFEMNCNEMVVNGDEVIERDLLFTFFTISNMNTRLFCSKYPTNCIPFNYEINGIGLLDRTRLLHDARWPHQFS